MRCCDVRCHGHAPRTSLYFGSQKTSKTQPLSSHSEDLKKTSCWGSGDLQGMCSQAPNLSRAQVFEGLFSSELHCVWLSRRCLRTRLWALYCTSSLGLQKLTLEFAFLTLLQPEIHGVWLFRRCLRLERDAIISPQSISSPKKLNTSRKFVFFWGDFLIIFDVAFFL